MSLNKIKAKIDSYIVELGEEHIVFMSSKIEQGKMLRSKLILAIAGESDEVIEICAVIELIQSASLLHDDVIDIAKTRRGKPSINALFGDFTSIMLGDIYYSLAFSKLSSFQKSVIKAISSSVTTLSIGELLDFEASKKFEINEEKYFKIISYKTASLIKASSEVGSILANKDAKLYGIYGENLGIAFQIIDDILDINGNSVKLGKPKLNDYKEGKVTLPYIYAYLNGNNNDKALLEAKYKQELNEYEQSEILEILHRTNAIEKSYNKAKYFANKALESIKDKNELKLVDVVESMLNRDF